MIRSTFSVGPVDAMYQSQLSDWRSYPRSQSRGSAADDLRGAGRWACQHAACSVAGRIRPAATIAFCMAAVSFAVRRMRTPLVSGISIRADICADHSGRVGVDADDDALAEVRRTGSKEDCYATSHSNPTSRDSPRILFRIAFAFLDGVLDDRVPFVDIAPHEHHDISAESSSIRVLSNTLPAFRIQLCGRIGSGFAGHRSCMAAHPGVSPGILRSRTTADFDSAPPAERRANSSRANQRRCLSERRLVPAATAWRCRRTWLPVRAVRASCLQCDATR